MTKLILAFAWLILCGLGAKYLPLWADWIYLTWVTVLVVGASWQRPCPVVPKPLTHNANDSQSYNAYVGGWNDCISKMRAPRRRANND